MNHSCRERSASAPPQKRLSGQPLLPLSKADRGRAHIDLSRSVLRASRPRLKNYSLKDGFGVGMTVSKPTTLGGRNERWLSPRTPSTARTRDISIRVLDSSSALVSLMACAGTEEKYEDEESAPRTKGARLSAGSRHGAMRAGGVYRGADAVVFTACSKRVLLWLSLAF